MTGADYTVEPRERSVFAVDVVSGQELWNRRIPNGGRLYFDLGHSQLAYRNAGAKNPSVVRVTDGRAAVKGPDADVVVSSKPVALRDVRLAGGLRYRSHRRRILTLATQAQGRDLRLAMSARVRQLLPHGDRALLAADGEIVSFDLKQQKRMWRLALADAFSERHRSLLRRARPSMERAGDKLLVQVRQFLLLIDARSGAVMWRDDVGKRLGKLWTREGESSATIARAGSIAVVAFSARVFAFDIQKRALLWSWMPDTAPFRSYPVVDRKRAYMVGGERRRQTGP